jgi:para-nitrobenzyl esterase
MEVNEKIARNVTRREFVSSASVVMAGVALSSMTRGESPLLGAASGQGNGAQEPGAVVLTKSGELQGLTHDGIHIFKGVPYAAPPTGTGRYMPPAKLTPWSGRRNAFSYGPNCPQGGMRGGGPKPGETENEGHVEGRAGKNANADHNVHDGQDANASLNAHAGQTAKADQRAHTDQTDMFLGPRDEDCLFLNVWTSALDGGKRPVMFWLHGGGFAEGSGKQNGENLARRGDVVVVTINHRIGVLGFLDLTAYGPEFSKSANVGMLDVVAALEWVRDNIDKFGGDAGNVTIFGQSGGGGKVTALMAMPIAKGLFHKAIVMSGSMLYANTPDESATVASTVLSELGLSKQDATRICEVPIDKLVAAGTATRNKLEAHTAFTMGRQLWGPTLDSEVLPNVPFDPALPLISTSIPLMVGTTINEFGIAMRGPKGPPMTEAVLQEKLFGTFGLKSRRIIEVAHNLYPEAKPDEIFALVTANIMFRGRALQQAERQSAADKAPVYSYLFCFGSHGESGKLGALHASDIAFAFYEMDDWAFADGKADAIAMAAKISDAWIAFARKGDPSHPGLPTWPQFNPKQENEMFFNTRSEVRTGYDRELRKLLSYEFEIDGR